MTNQQEVYAFNPNYWVSEPTKVRNAWELQDFLKPQIDYMDTTDKNQTGQFVTQKP